MVQNKKCKRCKHEWFARTEQPIQCPKCKSYYWDVDKEVEELKKKIEG